MDAILPLNPKWETELCLNKAPLGWTMVSWSFLIEQSTKKLEKASKYRILCQSLLWTCGNWMKLAKETTEIPIFTAAWCPLLWSQVCTVAEPPSSRPAGASTPVAEPVVFFSLAFSCFQSQDTLNNLLNNVLKLSNHNKINKLSWEILGILGTQLIHTSPTAKVLSNQKHQIRPFDRTIDEQSMMWSMLAPCLWSLIFHCELFAKLQWPEAVRSNSSTSWTSLCDLHKRSSRNRRKKTKLSISNVPDPLTKRCTLKASSQSSEPQECMRKSI